MDFIEYRRKPVIVSARRISETDTMSYDVAKGQATINGKTFYAGTQPKVGDYIVKDAGGILHLRWKKVFEKEHVI